MHAVGRHRCPLDDRRRHAEVARPGWRGRGGGEAPGLTFLQIRDSHMGFDKPADPNAAGTLEEAAGKIRALPVKPSFMIRVDGASGLARPGPPLIV